jgi:hypothetical protein
LINNNFSKNSNFFFFIYKKKFINFNNFFLLFIFKNHFLIQEYFSKFLTFYKKNWNKTILNYNFNNYNIKIHSFRNKYLIFLNIKNKNVSYLNFSLNSQFAIMSKNYKNLIFKTIMTPLISLINIDFKFIYWFIYFFKKLILFNFYFNYNMYIYVSSYNFKSNNIFSYKKNIFSYNSLRLKKNLSLLRFNYNLI